MTEKQANEILRTKYPEATIYRRKSLGGTGSGSLAVTFKEGGKVYDYYAQSYQQVLTRLGFDILYKHDVTSLRSEQERLKKEIEEGGEDRLFCFDGEDHWRKFSEDEIQSKRERIAFIDEWLSKAIITG